MEAETTKRKRRASLRTYSRRKSSNTCQPSIKNEKTEHVVSSTSVALPQIAIASRSATPSGLSSSSRCVVDFLSLHSARQRRRLNLRISSSIPSTKSRVRNSKIKRCTQTIIVAPSSKIIRCEGCGMEYHSVSDREAHDKYHHKSHLTFRPLLQLSDHIVYQEDEVRIQVVDGKSTKSIRNLAELALKYSYENGLDGEGITSKNLWGTIANPHDQKDPRKVFQYRLFITLYKSELVGILLAERISLAGYSYQEMQLHNDNRELEDDQRCLNLIPSRTTVNFDNLQKVYLSIDRIWVARKYQGQGLATLMADTAREYFIPGLPLEKKDVAISWPTRMGQLFAEKYFKGVFAHIHGKGKSYPSFMVNVKDAPGLLTCKTRLDRSVSPGDVNGPDPRNVRI